MIKRLPPRNKGVDVAVDVAVAEGGVNAKTLLNLLEANLGNKHASTVIIYVNPNLPSPALQNAAIKPILPKPPP